MVKCIIGTTPWSLPAKPELAAPTWIHDIILCFFIMGFSKVFLNSGSLAKKILLQLKKVLTLIKIHVAQ